MDVNSLLVDLNEAVSPFLYHPEHDTRLDKDCKGLSKEEVITRYHMNEIADTDLLIAKALAKIVFGTTDLINKAVEVQRIREPEKKLTEDRGALKGRLGALVKTGLVKKFKYRCLHDGREHAYFCLNGHGYNFLKRIYRFTDRYDEYLSITPFDEVVKWMATATAVLSAAKEPTVTRYQMGQPYFSKEAGRHNLYGELETLVGGQKQLVLFEPIFFHRNEERITVNEQEAFQKERLAVVGDYLTKRYVENPNVIIVCEDKEGLKKAMAICAKEFPSAIHHFYFTTDVLVHRHGLRNSLMRIAELKNGAPGVIDTNFTREFI